MRILTFAFSFLIGSSVLFGEEAHVKVSIAALNLPESFNGTIHWRSGAKAPTQPLQLSTRYFSAPVAVPAGQLQFYDKAFVPETGVEPPLPLISLDMASGLKTAYVVLITQNEPESGVKWMGKVFDFSNKENSGLKVVNAHAKAIGLKAGDKAIRLEKGESTVFGSSDWQESFPIKIFREDMGGDVQFSSTWRVAEGRNELCFITEINGRIVPRSLIHLPPPPPPKKPDGGDQ